MNIKSHSKIFTSAAVLSTGLAFLACTSVYAADETSNTSSSGQSTQVSEPSGASAKSSSQAQGSQATQGEVSIPLYQETLSVGKRTQDGQVVLRKVITTETVSQPVELRRESIVIDHIEDGSSTAANTGAPSSAAFQEKTFTIPVQREEAVIQKQTVMKGNVVARRSAQTERSVVQDQVRKEDVQVEDATPANGVVLRGKFYEINEAAGAQPKSQSQPKDSDQQK